MLRDPSSGAPYYLNKKTGATQWSPPPPPEGSLPPPWTSVLDPTSGRTYYYNGSNGESMWTALEPPLRELGCSIRMHAHTRILDPSTDSGPVLVGVSPSSPRRPLNHLAP